MRTLRTFLLEVHFLHIFCGTKHQNQKLMKVFLWLWVKKEKSGLGWGAITLQDSFLCFLGKNDESPFLNFFPLLNSPWFYPPISVFQLSLLVFYLCLFCAIFPQMKWNLKFHQISEQENPSHVVWWDLKLGLFPLRFVTWPLRLLGTVNAKCEKNFVLASVIKTPKSLGGSGLKYYPSVLQESQQLFFCCRSHPLITSMFLILFLFGSQYSHIFVSLIGTELVCEIHILSLT